MRASIAVACVVLSGCSVLEDRYQADMDKRRVADIDTLASLIEQYQAIVGAPPLAQRGYTLPVYVDMLPGGIPENWRRANEHQPGTSVPFEVFDEELRTVLGSDIRIPRDPQKVPTIRPTWYQYQFDGNAVFVAASLASEREATRRVGPKYFKYELRLPLRAEPPPFAPGASSEQRTAAEPALRAGQPR